MMDDDDDHHQQEEPCPPKESSPECSSREHKKDPFLMKLKISTPLQENGSKEVKDSAARTCKYCGKEFMNGMALGGHIRIHTKVGKLKGVGTSSKKLKGKIDELELGSAEREDANGIGEEQLLRYTCCICDERFLTNKSLCEHMRFHPERSWRGVQLPKMSEGDEEEEVDGNNGLFSEVHLLKDLISWSKTEKRGRISLAEPGAARGLMKLSRAIPDNLSSSDDASLKKKDRGQIHRSSKKDFRIPEVEVPRKIGRSVHPLICRKKKAANRSQFQCITCLKIFPTFQALGGHRSIHNKDRGIITRPLKISPCPDKNIIARNAIKEEKDSRCYYQPGNPCETSHEKSPKGHIGPLDQDLLAGSMSPADKASMSGPRVVLPIARNKIPTTDDDKALDSGSTS